MIVISEPPTTIPITTILIMNLTIHRDYDVHDSNSIQAAKHARRCATNACPTGPCGQQGQPGREANKIPCYSCLSNRAVAASRALRYHCLNNRAAGGNKSLVTTGLPRAHGLVIHKTELSAHPHMEHVKLQVLLRPIDPHCG